MLLGAWSLQCWNPIPSPAQKAQKININTNTHTHTYIYIYIYTFAYFSLAILFISVLIFLFFLNPKTHYQVTILNPQLNPQQTLIEPHPPPPKPYSTHQKNTILNTKHIIPHTQTSYSNPPSPPEKKNIYIYIYSKHQNPDL